MLTSQDRELLAQKGITEEQLNRQLADLKHGFRFSNSKPPLPLTTAAFLLPQRRSATSISRHGNAIWPIPITKW